MLLRFKLNDSQDWCVMTHYCTDIGENDLVGPVQWTRCGVFLHEFSDSQIMDFLAIDDKYIPNTKTYISDGYTYELITMDRYKRDIKTRKAKWGSLSPEERDERRRQYQREYQRNRYHNRKT